jgi:hypothetical protein
VFRQKPEINYEPVVPAGLIARTEKASYLVKNNKRFKFISERAKNSWNLKEILTSENAMRDVKISGFVGFRDGTLIKDISDSKIYLISDYKKFHVVDPDLLRNLSFNKNDIISVSQKEAAAHQTGGTLSA